MIDSGSTPTAVYLEAIRPLLNEHGLCGQMSADGSRACALPPGHELPHGVDIVSDLPLEAWEQLANDPWEWFKSKYPDSEVTESYVYPALINDGADAITALIAEVRRLQAENEQRKGVSSLAELSVEQLREIAHRATHYDHSHGNLPVIKLVAYKCLGRDEHGTIGVSYRDIAAVFGELAELRQRDV